MRFVWTPERRSEARRALAEYGRSNLAAIALSQRWGVQITDSMVRNAAAVDRMLAATSTPAPEAATSTSTPAPVYNEDLDATQECAPVFASENVAPAIHTSKTRGEARIIISDRQEPYSASGWLAFILAVAREFNVNVQEPDRVYDIGDEVDFYCFSKYAKSPDAPHTPNQELEEVRRRIARARRSLPHVRVCYSNHQRRLAARASEAGISTGILRTHHEILGSPEGWEWADHWIINGSRGRFLVQHGHQGPQSISAARQRSAYNGISTVWGHQHSQPIVTHANTAFQRVWSMCVGSLIDRDQVAFAYSKDDNWQPWIGCGVVLNGGTTPLLVPYGSL